jgi:hypothetical protein
MTTLSLEGHGLDLLAFARDLSLYCETASYTYGCLSRVSLFSRWHPFPQLLLASLSSLLQRQHQYGEPGRYFQPSEGPR